ncbi:hypothetical protein [Corynebacterium silvaticum]|uniref:hypothetical protein n=1 Tax=Corynebacterium silvaticum TaxID=2320431 RepID=UPI0021D7ABFC|nr:hypothetical protein [Corynebacterium silvaticum]UWH02894.1 hypothetical protein K1I38_03535 [Corynebacterium silvaticum]UXZ27093.1 hypothetical protein K3929_03535 [Corynebacterium silvaticum]UXZ29121.1 hypothetical protein K3930_03525 [Corynebacterium silvaticum]UXZ31175.1 hypothetical protein K3934_03540 [Corynebacterium silvaticum]UXZ33215.1 hypothetical protein K3911_03540 [Corynebacterium silvaticum]
MDNTAPLNFEEACVLTQVTNRPSRERSSVKHGDQCRINKGREQLQHDPVEIDLICLYVNEFLEALRMDQCANPRVELPSFHCDEDLSSYIKEAIYSPICAKGGDCKDMVWMKFTKDGYLGVVAMSNDINFNMPEPGQTANTSGIIIRELGKEWDKSFVLVFPLINFPEGMERGSIETEIGNFLIDKGVPILDFYSHRY